MALLSTWNYLVPAAGTTSAYTLNNVQATATPIVVDFSQVATISGLPFNPSGVVIDNTLGTIPAVVTINGGGLVFNISCPVGKQMGLQYPAPQGHTVSIIANGANLAFVDYPVIPYQF